MKVSAEDGEERQKAQKEAQKKLEAKKAGDKAARLKELEAERQAALIAKGKK